LETFYLPDGTTSFTYNSGKLHDLIKGDREVFSVSFFHVGADGSGATCTDRFKILFVNGVQKVEHDKGNC
jgi:hypothetical protein